MAMDSSMKTKRLNFKLSGRSDGLSGWAAGKPAVVRWAARTRLVDRVVELAVPMDRPVRVHLADLVDL
jgi:hypothetical protein